MIWDGKEIKEYTEIVRVALSLKGMRQKEFVELYCATSPYARQNMGYISGYYDRKTMAKIQKVFNTAHPVFGHICPTAEKARKMGQTLGRGATK